MMTWIRNHRGATIGGALVLVALVVFVLVWFEPQGLLFDTTVDEEAPEGLVLDTTTTTQAPTTTSPTTTLPPTEETTTTVPPPTTTTTTTLPPGPVVLSDSELIDVGRAGTGRVVIAELEDGSRVLRFEDLDVVNGPDLVVILSDSELTEDRELYDDGVFVEIEELKGNQGNQNYELADDIDLDDFQTVAIWCRRFNYTFNAAPIEAPSA